MVHPKEIDHYVTDVSTSYTTIAAEPKSCTSQSLINFGSEIIPMDKKLELTTSWINRHVDDRTTIQGTTPSTTKMIYITSNRRRKCSLERMCNETYINACLQEP